MCVRNSTSITSPVPRSERRPGCGGIAGWWVRISHRGARLLVFQERCRASNGSGAWEWFREHRAQERATIRLRVIKREARRKRPSLNAEIIQTLDTEAAE